MQEGEPIGTYHEGHRLLHHLLLLSEAWQNLVLPDLFVNHCVAFLALVVDRGGIDQELRS